MKNEQLTKYLKPLLNFWGKQTKKNKKIFIGSLGGLLVLSFVIVFILNINNYTVLYSGVSETEAAQIIQLLQEKGIDCKLQSGGVILVPKDQVDSIRMDLSTEGYPQSATNYDIFTSNIDLMTTDYEKRQLKIYQLNERLKTTIETIKAVKSAIVTISVPENAGYAWESNAEKPSASVMVEVADDAALTSAQVNGIKQLVAKSVPGLETSQVAVVDSSGTELQSSEDLTQMNITELGLTIKAKFEKDINDKVTNVLNPIFGKDNYAVSVNGIVNLDKKIQEIITYTPSDEKNNTGVLSEGSKSTVVNSDGSGTGGAAGATDNTDLPTYAGVTINGNIVYIQNDETYKYLVNQVTEQVEHDAAVLDQLNVAVTINLENMNENDKAKIQQLVATAAATDLENVYVYNSKFSAAGENNSDGTENNGENNVLTKQQIIIAASALGGILIAVMTVIFIIVRRKKKRPVTETENESQDYTEPAEDMTVEDKIKFITETKQQKMKEVIQEFSTKNPEIAAQLIRSWLKEDGE